LLEDDILAILRRYDNDGDGKISYLEFVNAILPADSSKRLGLSKSEKKMSNKAYV